MTDVDSNLTPPGAGTPAADAAPAVPPVEPAESAAPPALEPVGGVHWGTGRRKCSVARVRLVPGSGKFLINKRDLEQYFCHFHDRNAATAPLEVSGVRRHVDIHVNVRGGGTTGQAGAVRMGLARAIAKAYSHCEQALRDAGLMTRDSRSVERKKYGRRKARRRFQFSKR